MAFLRWSRGGPDPYLYHKYLAFAIGTAAAFTGMIFEIGWLVNAAIVIMLVALIGSRIASSRRPPPEE